MVRHLPFSITLRKFTILHYPGTTTPRDYVSRLAVEGGQELVVSMNNIGKHEGYRLYQSSFDEDAKGTLLTVNHDPYGIPLTYAGYGLLFAAMLYSLVDPRGGFRALLRHPLLRRSAMAWLLLGSATLAHADLPTVERTQADSFARKQVVYHDRVCPLNTLALDFCKKIYGKPTFQRLSPEQVLLSWIYFPEAWQEVPMIAIKDATLRAQLGIEDRYARLTDLFDGDVYRLQTMLAHTPESNTQRRRAIQEVDEKVGLILMLLKGTLLQRVGDKDARLTPTAIEVELFYNRLRPVLWLFPFNLSCGLLAALAMVLRWRQRWVKVLLVAALAVSTAALLSVFALRWYIGGYVPLSNGFETMLFMALSCLVVALLLLRRIPVAMPFGFLLAGFSLLVAHLGEMNPSITPLVPVLASPLLSLHVTIIMVAYALLAFIAMNSGYSLWLLAQGGQNSEMERQVQQHTLYNQLLLYPAVYLLAAGIFVGAMWANVSWGRYWGWDPKEVWALITLLIYSFALHGASLPCFRRPFVLHLFLLLAFLSVLVTYFGVNYLLGGRHAYA